MIDSSQSAGRFDPDRLADWLLTGAGVSPVREPADWLAVTDVLTTTISLALADHVEWRRYVSAYNRALDGMEQAGARSPRDVSQARSTMIGLLANSVPLETLPQEWQPERVAEVFFEQLPMSRAEAIAMLEATERPPLSDLMRLRYIKQNLNRVQAVMAFLPAETVDRLRPWLELRARLP